MADQLHRRTVSQKRLSDYEQQVHNELLSKAVCKECPDVEIFDHSIANALFEWLVARSGIPDHAMPLVTVLASNERGVKVVEARHQQPFTGPCCSEPVSLRHHEYNDRL